MLRYQNAESVRIAIPGAVGVSAVALPAQGSAVAVAAILTTTGRDMMASHDPEINKRWEDGKAELMHHEESEAEYAGFDQIGDDIVLSDPRGDKRIAELETQVKRLQAENHLLWAHDHANGHTMRKDNEDIQTNTDCFICQLYGKVEK